MTMENVDVYKEQMYFRNNAQNKPTKIHFIFYGDKAVCGFKDNSAEIIIGDKTDNVLKSQCCEKCLDKLLEKQEDECYICRRDGECSSHSTGYYDLTIYY